MKKYIAIALSVVLIAGFCACSKTTDKSNEVSSAVTVTEQTTKKALPKASTTAKAKKDESKANKLKKNVSSVLNVPEEDVAVQSDGGFEYKNPDLDETKMYSQEYSDEMEKEAFENIDAFVKEIKNNYPDNKKIERFSTDIQQLSFGDNGIDSVNYIAVYINSQNQSLTVYADSTGTVYYAKCEFTW
ncbi:MAG: hypothetical protein NC213_04735 [Acetobacter sp.]|nr:hypothetical protein [Bacteroides sp.]MCM1341031.1 hypothetical protein [Acetobacter sp.]MCM1432413.1 hypothetical protein [Clostridiales bacterium]